MKDKLCCVIYALMMLCLLSSCTEKSEMPIDNTPSSESPSRLEDVCLNSPKSDQELKKKPETTSNDSDTPPIHAPTYGITMYVGSDKALINGAEVALPEAPFLENEVVYFPLQFVAEALGYSYSYRDGLASIELFGHTTQYEVGSGRIIIDGTEDQVSGNHYLFREDHIYRAADETFVPIMRNDVIFLPFGFLSSEHVSFFNYFNAQQYPEKNMLVFNGSATEEGIAGFYLREKYDDLPQELRSSMNYIGVVGQSRDLYDVVEYERNGLFVHVLRLPEGEADLDGIDGVIGSVCVTKPDIPTPRGLCCGDTAERAWELYGYAFAQSFSYDLENGVISRLGFYAYFDDTFGFAPVYQ